MARAERKAIIARVRIVLDVEAHDPPAGTVTREDDEALLFSGWLDLLRVLSELLEVPLGRPPPP